MNKNLETILARGGGDPKHWHSLTEEHVLAPSRGINMSKLRFHLLLNHGINVKDSRTKAELGRLHLLAHALLAHPQLQELLGDPFKKWDYR